MTRDYEQHVKDLLEKRLLKKEIKSFIESSSEWL